MPLLASRDSGMENYGCFRFLFINTVIMVFVQIMTIEWSTVAILYDPSENNVRICLITFIPYRSGFSVSGCTHVFLNVGMNATKSIPTTIIIEIVGSLVKNQGMRPRSAIMRKYVSPFRIYPASPLNKYLKEMMNIIRVKLSAIPVGRAPIPAPFAIPPKNVVMDTIDQINHVYG